MAWLRLTKQTGCEVLVNTDQVSEFTAYNDGTTVWCPTYSTDVRESIYEIVGMIEQAERLERAEGIFRSIVYNFPQGYDPVEIWKTAWRLMDARDELEES